MGQEHFIDPTATVAASAVVGHGCVVHEGVTIGERAVLGAHVVVHADTQIGSDCRVFDNAVLGRPPMKPFKKGRAPSPDLPGLRIGDGCVIGSGAVVYRGSSLGDRVLVGDGAGIREEVTLGDEVLIAMGVTVNYNTSVGTRTRIMDLTHITGNAVIEEDVFISMHVTTTNDNTMSRPADRPATGPTIRSGASVGGNSVLLPGIEIGRDAVVAAGSVVTRDVPAGVLVVGAPARPR